MLHTTRRRAAAALVGAALATVLGGCGTVINNETDIMAGSSPWVVGSGGTTSVTRQLESFDSISVDGPLNVTVSTGSAGSATITADDNLIGLIATRVADGRLTIELTAGLKTTHRLDVEVTTAGLNEIAQRGTSTVDFEAVSATELTVDVGAASTLRAGGRAETLTLTVGGASTADLRNVSTDRATVHVDAASTSHVRVSGTVSGDCMSASTLLVSGGALIDVRSDVSSTVKAE